MPAAAVTRLVREHLVPVLADRGFRRAGSTFRRPAGETVQVVQVQRSTRNGPALARFSLNGSVYVPALDELLDAPVLTEPDEPSCHLRWRPHDVLPDAPAHYDVAADADVGTVGAVAARDLVGLLDALDRRATADAVVDELAGRALAQYERVAGWYLSHDRTDDARVFVTGLHERFGDERRWEVFARHLDAVVDRVGGGADWRSWI
ncbi:DUF4304 domain-containing protein [Cellulosimicrobium sp. E-16]|uniref:DUF4304 domain-containing protein n=1 Tax=Cellulosimicrobium sp. E-16 TaxID=3404049 RepID=UPI003CF6F72D